MAVWDDPRVAPHVREAAKEIRDKFGITNIGGFASSGHISNSDHYTGHALDVMTFNGTPVEQWALANGARLGVKYTIWNRRYKEPDGTDTPYSGGSPHTDHVHISFNRSAGTGPIVDAIAGGGQAQNERAGCAKLLIDMFGLLVYLK